MNDQDDLNASSTKWLEVRRLFNAAVRRALADELPAREFLNPIDDAERQCLALIGTKHGCVEVERRAAESRILVASMRDGISIECMESLRNALRTLGYTDLSREVSMEILFARSCIAHGRTDYAASVLHEILIKLESALGRADVSPEAIDTYLDDKAIIERILTDLESKS